MRLPVAIVLGACLGSVAPGAIAQQHEHAPAPAAAPDATPVRRFATDATLRREMQGVRTAVEGLGHYQRGHLGQAQAISFAGQVEEHVRTIIATCKLPPDADAALHRIIVPLMQGAAAIKKDPQNLAAIPPMEEALAEYGRRFDDPSAHAPARH